MDKENKEKGFTLEGRVHEEPISEYVQEQIEQNNRRPRMTIAILSTIAMVLFIWASISQYRLQQNKKLIKEAEDLKALYSGSGKGGVANTKLIDSLQNEILKLQSDNDLLAENSPDQAGVFFEVQLGSFSDFNMNKYLENLANLRQEKHQGKAKFLLGRFRSFNKAILFENDLKRMGINNAFLVGRIDGKLVTYQEALDESGQNKN